jgi:hypothetical protein
MKKIFLFSILVCSFVQVLVAFASAAAESGYAVRACGIMDEPYRDAKEIASLEEGATVTILKRKGGWLNISTETIEGWVRMLYIRRGQKEAEPSSATEAKGVLDLASGRAGTGNVVAATGVRGLSEEDLKEAEYNAKEIRKLESFSISKKQAEDFAKEAKLESKAVEFLH